MALNKKRALLQLLALVPLPLLVLWILSAAEKPPVAPLTGGSAGGGEAAGSAGPALKLPAKLPSGWTLKGKVSRYDRKTLYDRINGAAPAYLRAGYVGSLGGEYAKAGFKDTVMVDVYDMGSTAQALGMYSTERDPSYTFCEAGDEGYLASGSMNLWSGRYYVKLAGFEQGEAMDAGLKELAGDMVKTLPPAKDRAGVEASLKLLPAQGRLEHGAGYSKAALGDVAGLEQVFTALYGPADGPVTLFAVAAKDTAAATKRLARALKYFEGFGGSVEKAALEGGGEELVVTGEGASHVLVLRGVLLAGALDLTGPAQVKRARELLGFASAGGVAAGAEEEGAKK